MEKESEITTIKTVLTIKQTEKTTAAIAEELKKEDPNEEEAEKILGENEIGG